MDTRQPFVVSLEDAFDFPAGLLGNKARNLSLCLREGFHVPAGFVLTAESYTAFIEVNNLQPRIDMELHRKDLASMRWEEIWDTALRIRSYFMKGALPEILEEEITAYLTRWPAGTKFAARSSAAAEDSASASFAGIHESYLNITPVDLIEKVKLVWASLWSDRSLLYREEKKLDSRHSIMPVLIQEMEPAPVSGLAFSADPLSGKQDVIVIELIGGSLDLLVDNIREPERFIIEKNSGRVLSSGSRNIEALITGDALEALRGEVLSLEKIFGQPVDIEWTGLKEAFTVLQVRPITKLQVAPDDERAWYLTLTPEEGPLVALAERVEKKLIPDLIEEIERFSGEESIPEEESLFLERLESRGESYNRWKKVYREEFIPFAHGIRTFGTYYNDLVKPDDPYEFTMLLKSEGLYAQQRNRQLEVLAEMLSRDAALKKKISEFPGGQDQLQTERFLQALKADSEAGQTFAAAFNKLLSEQMDLYYDNVSLADDPGSLLQTILGLAESEFKKDEYREVEGFARELEKVYLEKAGADRHGEAVNWLRIGRLSWKLRDNDNILLSKLENQLYLYLKEGLTRLLKAGLSAEASGLIQLDEWPKIAESLKRKIEYSAPLFEEPAREKKSSSLKPRQLVGQPSSKGLVTGNARVIRSVADFKDVQPGEILVFDAVQPQMTFIISLAAGIVERRGGMLVHSSIIARELNIPAVNGVSGATELIETGDLVTLNGDLGLVIIGEPEFYLEQG